MIQIKDSEEHLHIRMLEVELILI